MTAEELSRAAIEAYLRGEPLRAEEYLAQLRSKS